MRILIISAICFFGITSFATPPGQYAIINVSVIPMNREEVLNDQTILIEDGVIKSMGKSTQLKVPKNYSIINGRGKYVIPGLIDMHAHFYYEQGQNKNTCEEELKLMLANGVTTARIQCGDSVYLDARKMIQQKRWEGPTLFVSSPQFVGAWPWGGKVFGAICTTPEQAKAAVRKFKNQGYDAIKITFMVRRDVYDAIINTAREVGIKVTGHVGPLVKLPAALAAGQQNEHMDEFIDMLLPDTTFNHGQSVSDMNLWRKKAWETVPYLDENKIPELVRMVKDAGIYVTPTNYFFFSFFGKGIDEKIAKAAPEYRYIPQVLKDEADRVRAQYYKNLPAAESRAKYVDLRKKITRELWRAGVPLMAGSDSPQWYSVSGFALHRELETFVECGLSPFASLQTATIHPAKYLGVDASRGTIEVGKQADLLMLSANPLENISNVQLIEGLFAAKWYDKNEVKRLMNEALVLAK